MSEQPICGKCGLPIHKAETGLRYFGHYIAHNENRCLELLRSGSEALERQLAEAQESNAGLERANTALLESVNGCQAELSRIRHAAGEFNNDSKNLITVVREMAAHINLLREGVETVASDRDTLRQSLQRAEGERDEARRELQRLNDNTEFGDFGAEG